MFPYHRGVRLLLALLLCSHLPAGAAEDKPGTPQNLALISQGPNAMMMTWQKPSSNDADHYLVYVDGTELQNTTEIPFYIWKGLEACTSYTFGVMAVSSSDLMSDPALADGETDADSKLFHLCHASHSLREKINHSARRDVQQCLGVHQLTHTKVVTQTSSPHQRSQRIGGGTVRDLSAMQFVSVVGNQEREAYSRTK